ncbi:diguanylate cyclase [Alkalilimnicola sp. S0819]|uniref:sensor domain-containing diguanylate cyclase n=1 Tax=Alkalilimnicola sp. S0819 TaxID=2613922 RepID=UPI0012617A33|nr:diguanylate cyclase [Alkalilimnicola sp. S0819]KAB7624068.1 diguanylate cyclase [Alkalilimnicola sp. S0819]MPQ16318.1 diguanylate cyclase [Alkalilimnicola sp. S0819]
MSRTQRPHNPFWQAAKVALAYCVTAFLWIAFSDDLLGRWLGVSGEVTRYQTIKGWGFVLVSGLVLYVVVLRYLRLSAGYAEEIAAQRVEIQALSQFRANIIDNASIWLNVLDPQANILVWNKAAEQITGYSRDEVRGNARIWDWLYPDPQYRGFVRRKATELLEQGASLSDFHTRITARDGTEKVIAWEAQRLYGSEGELVGAIALGQDITERLAMEQALVENERYLTTLLGNLPGMAYRCLHDQHWTMKFVSAGCEPLTGYPPQALLDNAVVSYASLIHPEDMPRVAREAYEAETELRPFALEYRLRRRDGREIWVWEQGRVLEEESGLVEGFIMEITERKLLEQELAQLAIRDPLTGLFNRRELERRLCEELERSRRYGHALSLLMIDVDHFKAINDALGHERGDEVLCALSRQLQRSVRPMDYVARYGGEELLIVLPELSAEQARGLAERIRSETEAAYPGSHPAGGPLTLSIGVAAYPAHGASVAGLLRAADQAMYSAKRAGRNCVRLAPEASAAG